MQNPSLNKLGSTWQVFLKAFDFASQQQLKGVERVRKMWIG
jgi:hypothetical protein